MIDFGLSTSPRASSAWVDAADYGFAESSSSNGAALDRAAAAAAGGVLWLPPGDYELEQQWASIADGTWVIGWGVRLVRNFSAEFQAVIELNGVDRVRLFGLEVDGQKTLWSDTTGGGEHRHGVRVVGSSRVELLELDLHDHRGDGAYVGAISSPLGPDCEDVALTRVRCVDNHRNGFSITGVRTLRTYNCRYEGNGVGGVLPGVGVDIEPNDTTSEAFDIVFSGDVATGNAESGFAAFIGTTTTALQEGWKWLSCSSYLNGASGWGLDQVKDVLIDDPLCYLNPESGIVIGNNSRHIRIRGGMVRLNGEHGIFAWCNAVTKFLVGFEVSGTQIHNNNTGGLGRDGIRIDWTAGPAAGCSDVRIDGVSSNNAALYSAVSNQQRYGISTDGGANFTKLSLCNCNFDGNTLGVAVLLDDAASRKIRIARGLVDVG